MSIQSNPILIVFIIFASYMFGSMFRAIPVYWAELTIPPFNSSFPHPDVLNEVVSTLNNNIYLTMHDQSKFPSIKDNLPMHVFNYWKDVLCINSIEGFVYYQSFETRVRLFSGIIWASWSGIIGSIYIFLQPENDFSHAVGLPLFIISLVLIITFGSNFRRVRRQEARALFLIYFAYLQKVTETNSADAHTSRD